MRRVDFDCGLAAALGVSGTLYVLTRLTFDPAARPLSWPDVIILITAAASYLAAAFARGPLTRFELVRRVPGWIFVPLIGSALLVPPFYGYYRAPGAFEIKWGLVLKLLLVFTSYSSLFTACAYFSGHVMRAARKWHRGPDHRGTSILR